MRLRKRITAAALAVIMVCSMFLGHLPENVFAAETKTMAHLKAGSGNNNGHFGNTSREPEAFVLSTKSDVTGERISATIKLLSDKEATRLRFVTKYVDDTHWGYVGYDGNWFYEYKNGDASSWPSIDGLPLINQNDVVNMVFEYVETGLQVTVNNVTANTSGTAVVTDTNCISLKNQAGKVGFGAGAYVQDELELTDLYFSDVVIGDTAYTNYTTDFALYKENVEGQVFEVVEVEVEGEGSGEGSGDEPGDDPVVDPSLGRAWYTITGGSNNSGGHAYGNADATAPILLLDNDKVMENGGAISLAVKPSVNWGVFYSYVDDNNWLYVGYDNYSQWYYQYKLNGSESYPKISGLPTPVEGEELQMSVSLSNETLAVTVNGTTVRVTNQTLIDFAAQNAGKGRFGVKTNGQTSISFADFKYNNADCMGDSWVFCAERAGQQKEIEYSPVAPVTGIITDVATGLPVEGASVYFNNNVAKTAADGTYSFVALELGTYTVAVSKPGYVAYSGEKIVVDGENVFDIEISEQPPLDLTQYDSIQSDVMKVYIGKEFPLVARYEMLSDATTFFRGNENALNTVKINGISIEPTVTVEATTEDSRTYAMHVEDQTSGINFDMKVKISVDADTLTWEVIELKKAVACPKIATIDVDGLNLLTISAVEEGANFAGAGNSTVTTVTGDVFQSFEDGFVPSAKDGYLYGILTNGKLSAGLFSNSEAEGDKRVIRSNGADTMSLTSAPWYYELGDKNGQRVAANYADYPVSELPWVKVAIAADVNNDNEIDWNDGALACRKIVHIPYGSEVMKDMVNYRIVMNFSSMAPNPFLATADNIKKVYLATDGLPQGVVLKGYGNEGHDSANSEYADIAEREGGVEDFRDLIKIAHKYNTEVGIHINAQEAYPEARSFNEVMLESGFPGGWGWLDQSHVINKIWDLSSQARWKRLVQLYDRINGTNHMSLNWEAGEYVLNDPENSRNSLGTVDISKEAIQQEAEANPDNMDFIYLDVWYQDAWETRRIAEEFNALGWRFSTEFSAEGEYDSTWHHWSTDAPYGGAAMKGYNSDIIRFIRNDQRDSQVLNYPSYGGTADNPLLGGYRLYGFEGWGGDQNFNNYILQTFNQNLPTRFLQHYYVVDWENYEDGQSPVGNHEREITLWNDEGDVVIVTRNEEQRADENIERTITLNGTKILDDVTYLLPWTEEDGTVKLYHWNLDGGTTTWTLTKDFAGLENVVVYELSDQGRINEKTVAVVDNTITLEAKAATAYVVVKGASVKTLADDFGECDYVVDPGFNGYAAGEQLDEADWSGDIEDASVVVEKHTTGDQRLAINSPKKEITLSTKISGLEVGKDYVAEFYVENNSDAKAYIIVDAGAKEVSNYTEKSISYNYVQCDIKHGTNMQRMQVSFVAESTEADLIIVREAGKGSTYIDDIRIVEIKLNNFQEDGTFVQDFETVVQGLYPFVIGGSQGVTDHRTHLSQLNAPYTQAGWNGRVIDDVIDGNWSLKHHTASTGIVYQTIPQNFRFEPGKVYTVEFDYQSGPNKAYVMVVGDGTTYTIPAADDFYPAAHGEDQTQHVTMQVVGSGSGQTWIGLYQAGNRSGSGSMGETDFTLDNLVIRENKEANNVVIEKTELFKGETAAIIGNNVDKITWSNSNPQAVAIDKEAGMVKALTAGTATLTATFPEGEPIELVITVVDSEVKDIPRAKYPNITASANTEETSGEGAGNGTASCAVDGNPETYWHSQWSASNFAVSADHPAVITADLGEELAIGGFKFQQRAVGVNGTVFQYSYRVLAADGTTVVKENAHIVTSNEVRVSGAWEIVKFDELVNARYIEISVEEGLSNVASLSEICPISLVKVADTVTLRNVTLYVGDEKELTPVCSKGTVLKGIVWNSSNEAVATVDANGVVTALGLGTTVITMSNAAGLEASCTVTVATKQIEAELKGHTLSLEGNIGVNFHMQLGAEVLADAKAYMNFALDGEDYMQVLVNKAVQDEETGYYVFKCAVPVKDMDTEITAQIVLEDGRKGTVYTYAVKDYASSILNNDEEYAQEVVELVEAMSAFGDFAATYFAEGTIAETPEMEKVTEDTLASYAGSVSENSIYVGSSLLLKSETVVRHYFTEAVEGSTKKDDHLYYIEYTGIPAHELGEKIETTVGDITISYSPLSYAYAALSNDDVDENLKSLMREMYLYHTAAQNYLDATTND